jgi:hypothetical protein
MSVPPTNRARPSRARRVVVSTVLLIAAACRHAHPTTTPEPTAAEPSEQRPGSTGEVRSIHFPGVDIVPTARSGFVIRIHSGLVGDGEPLYVIDGAPIRVSPGRGIDWFKPEDIVEIKVLKRPYELAEYGPNGVNGVIVITTRQNPARRQRR